MLQLHEAYWGSPAALSWDDTDAESTWLATDLGGKFEQGDSSASDLVSAEGVNYKRRETAEQDRNFCTLALRRKNLMAASRDDLLKKFLDHLQLRELELHKLSWEKFTREFKLTDKGTQQRAKIEQQLSFPSQSTIPNLHETPAHETAPAVIIEPRSVSFADGCTIQRYYYTKVLLSKVLFIQRYYWVSRFPELKPSQYFLMTGRPQELVRSFGLAFPSKNGAALQRPRNACSC